MEKASRHIVILGPESTGKSTLAAYLSTQLRIPFVPEYAREYLDLHDTDYALSDLDRIAQGQGERMEQDPLQAMIFDTDLLNIYIWKRDKYGQDDQRMLNCWKSKKVGLYLLLKPDVEWVFDPMRECEDSREDLFQQHIQLLDAAGIHYSIVSGDYPEREQRALELCRNFLGT